MNKRFKLIVGAKQLDVLIAGVAYVYNENDLRISNLEQYEDDSSKADLSALRDEMNRAEELRIKLVRMKYEEEK